MYIAHGAVCVHLSSPPAASSRRQGARALRIPGGGGTGDDEARVLLTTVASQFPKVLVSASSVTRPADVVVRRNPSRLPEEEQVGKQTVITSAGP